MVVLDLFSGAGGLSEGFFRQGATFVGHVEADSYACETLKTRTAYWNLKKQNKLNIYHDYLLKKISTKELLTIANIDEEHEIINKAIAEETIKDIYKDISINMKRNNVKKVDVIIGGPPCQAYSVVGRARMKESVKDDHRNFLYKFMYNF